MKITLIRKDEEQGTEALSLCDSDAFLEKIKTENKAGHISERRESSSFLCHAVSNDLNS